MAQKINIRPDVSILAVLKNLNYTYWHALAEFVDNAVQSYSDNKNEIHRSDKKRHPLRVNITLSAGDGDGGQIVILDNAAGIHPNDFERAFKAGSPPPNQSGLSEFGMGMKTAATWCADRWSVRTSPLGMPLEYTIEYDIPKIVSKKIQELNVLSSAAKTGEHYTEVRLEKLNHLPTEAEIKRVKLHLASIYRVLLKTGELQLTVNKETLSYETPAILVAPYHKSPTTKPRLWRQDVNLDFGRGVRVTGFVAIRELGSTAEAGLALIRRNRVIVGSGDKPYRPKAIFGAPNKFPHQRLFGELNLEGFRVAHTKDGVIWGNDVVDEDSFLAELRTQISTQAMPLLDQALNYVKGRRKGPSTPGENGSDGGGQGNTSGQPRQPGQPGGSTPEGEGAADSKGNDARPEAPSLPKPIRFAIPTTTEEVVVRVSFIRESSRELLTIGDPKAKDAKAGRELPLTLNLEHALFTRGERPALGEIHRLSFLLSALGVAELMVRDANAGVGAIRNHLNRYAKFMPSTDSDPGDNKNGRRR